MLGTRLVIGFSMVGVVLAVLAIDERFAPWFPLWFGACTVAGTFAALELVGLLGPTAVGPSRNAVLGGVLAVIVANWAPHLMGAWHHTPLLESRVPFDPMTPVHDLAWPALSFAAVLMATFACQGWQFDGPGATTARIAGTAFVVAYVGLLGSFLIQLRWLDGPYHGLFPVVFLCATAKGADTGAYTVGRLAGRHKLWPRLSPNKTVEGALGGLAFGVAAALIVAALARWVFRVPTLEWGAAVGFGAVVSTAAQFGDLMESMIKRDCSRKDASDVVPGFGGVLDVLDSLLFAAPVGFSYWLLFGP